MSILQRCHRLFAVMGRWSLAVLAALGCLLIVVVQGLKGVLRHPLTSRLTGKRK